MAVGRIPATDARKERVAFTAAIDYMRYMLVAPTGSSISSKKQLTGSRIQVREGTPAHDELTQLSEDVEGLEIVEREEGTLSLINEIREGRIDATVVSSEFVDSLIKEYPQLEAQFAVTESIPVAWAVRKDSKDLKEQLDGVIYEAALDDHKDNGLYGDLDAIKERGVLRVLTRNNETSFFLYRGQEMGFEYELVKRFAEQLDVRLQIVVPRDPYALIALVGARRGGHHRRLTDDRR